MVQGVNILKVKFLIGGLLPKTFWMDNLKIPINTKRKNKYFNEILNIVGVSGDAYINYTPSCNI